MELDSPSINFDLPSDRRLPIPEPLPVRLIAVADVTAQSAAGLENDMNALYAGILQFQRVAESAALVYRADNFDLRFEVREPPFAREDMRPIMVEVPSLAAVQALLVEREIEHTRQKSIAPGQESLVLQDPSGNWVEVTQRRAIV